ncbi:MAG: family 78 glycoside hydrolase catalytic domain [Lentisphaerae bacterium]|jgi:alpha-L-rhamnosidase|nr:family 78 glycoside hydrolase catalytic domain [Lentisphaerota bacterium]MBT5607403.1 family 78 glycoside hydrolase catalytic domain [Lentisphaerota bacterium]MBT7056111.1 family 78 glycoside hydrolase catalytic domain [Lentisphaerota bacterium]MBT7841349.1 family 78 glycoside hydrolase catalytic domain [Lentisphaerota bacterium]
MTTLGRQYWVTTPWGQDDPPQPRRNPIFRKTVSVDGAAESATLDICGLGHYELWLNGTRVGDRQLEPAFTDYDKRVHYSTYDIGALLKDGENILALYLGRGRFNMDTVSVWGYENAPWRDQCRFTLAGEIIAGGKTSVLDTTGWKCTEGPIFRDSMYEGEGFDARLEPEGWLSAGFDDSSWENAVETHPPKGELLPAEFEPIRIVDELPVARTVFADDDRVVFEFPDMLAGNVRIRVSEPAGTRIHITYTEGHGDGQSVSKEHNHHISGEYFQEDDYICCGGGEEVWQARFSYKGFRYVEITGFTGEFAADQVTALDLHQDLESRGSFSCGNGLINKIHHASRRALLNNAHHTVTDTPTYEKNGWTGDAQLTATMGLYNFEIERFYRKFVTDMRDSQEASGELAPIVPTSGWGLTDNPNAKWHAVLGAVPAWDAALFVMMWETYLFTGDLEIVRENYGAMQQYLTYLDSVANEHIVEVGLGDWLPPGGPPSEGPAISSTAWYYRLNEILENCAGLLGDEPCRDRCRALKAEIREAFNKRFLNSAKDGYETGTETEYRQTSSIQPLAFGLVPDAHHSAVFTRLKSALCEAGRPSLNTGILGTRFLLEVLADNDEVDVAYALLTSEEYPSWGHWFANGGVSLEEAWELDRRSFSHHMFGSIDAWLYQYLAGIRPTTAGFREIAITPHVPTALPSVAATVVTPAGEAQSNWHRDEAGSYRFELVIPKGVTATFALPKGLPGIAIGDDCAKTGLRLASGTSAITVAPNGEVTCEETGTC